MLALVTINLQLKLKLTELRQVLGVLVIFGTGCTWHNLVDKSVQDAFLRNMMFGQSNSQQVNTAYYKEKYWGEFGEYDYSKSTSSATLTGRIWEATLMGYVHSLASDNLSNPTDTVNVPCTISVPHWPTEYLRDLTSGLFVYNNNGLKYGEGMPLRVDNQTMDTCKFNLIVK